MAKIGKDVVAEFSRTFVPGDADLGDPDQVESLFDALDEAKLASAPELESWLLKWSELAAALREEEAVRYIRMTCQTDDAERERAYLYFVENVSPRIKPRYHKLAERFLASQGLKDLPKERYRVLVTFVEPARDLDARAERRERFLRSLGAWQDERPVEATLKDILEARRSRSEPPSD